MSIGTYTKNVYLAVKGKPKAPTVPVAVPIEGYYPYHESPDYGIPSVDDLVRDKGLEVYRDMDRDEQVAACVALPQLARLSSGWKLADPGEDEQEKEIHAFCEHGLDDLDEMSVSDLLLDLMDAIPIGFSVSERVMREPYGTSPHPEYNWAGKQGIRTFRTLAQETVTFKQDEHGDFERDGVWQAKPPQVAPGLDPSHFNKYPRDRFVIWSYKKRWGNPLGMSILRPAYRWTYGKNRMLQRWLRYMETYGEPFLVAPTKEGTNESTKTAIKAQLKNLLLSHVMASPTGLIPQIIPNPQHASAVDAFVKFFEVANKAISKTTLTPPTIMDVGDGGSFALGKVQSGSFIWVLDSYGVGLRDRAMNEQVLRPLVRHNFGPTAPAPSFEWLEWSKGDLVAIATMFATLHNIGFPLSKKDMAKALGLEIADDEEDMLPKAQPAAPPASPFSPFGEMDVEDTIAEGEQLDALAADLMRTSLDPSGDDLVDTLRGNGEKSRQYARDQFNGVLEGRR